MSTASLFAYALAVVIAVATPGPAMMALIARALARGSRAALGMALGIAFGDVTLGSLALLGLAALMAAYGWLLVVLKYAAAIYLFWLGVRMWRAPASAGIPPPTGRRDVMAGLGIALSNPKAILFHASLMPLIIDLRQLDGTGAATILAIIFAGNLLVMSIYAVTAGAGRSHFRSPSRLRSMNRLAGGAMIGAGAAIVAR